MSDFPSEKSPTIKITLVHGTWARGILRARETGTLPRWFESGHPFFDELIDRLKTSGLNYEILPEPWSGANSIIERHKAAETLSERLRKDNDSDCIQIIIGHSHGGNIALTATSLLRKIDSSKKVAIISLATPFLSIFDTSASRAKYFRNSINALAYSFALSVSFLTFLGLQLFFPTTSSIGTATFFIALVFLGILSMKAAIGKSEQRKGLAYVGLLDAPNIPLTILRTPDDEATLFIAASAIGTKLSHGFIVSAPHTHIKFIIMTAIASYIFLPIFSDSSFVNYASKIIFLMATLASLWSIAICIAVLFGTISRCANGRELFWGGMSVDVNVHSAPDHVGQILVRTVSDDEDQRGFRHAIYNYEECPQMVMLGIGRALRQFGYPGIAATALG